MQSEYTYVPTYFVNLDTVGPRILNYLFYTDPHHGKNLSCKVNLEYMTYSIVKFFLL